MKKGFTLMEILITISIFAILAVIATLNLTGSRNGTNLAGTTKQIGALLREAQSDTMSDDRGTVWGVHFDNAAGAPFYALFASSTYSAAAVVGRYPLSAGVTYATSTLPQGSAINIIFAQITGAASASTSIVLYAPGPGGGLSSTISIASSGAVGY